MEFAWRDGERTIRFGRGVAADAVRSLGGPGYLLLTTPRAEPMLPAVVEAGAEMTRIHRHAAGVADDTPRVRCAVVVYDPALAASQPEAELAASALNAL